MGHSDTHMDVSLFQHVNIRGTFRRSSLYNSSGRLSASGQDENTLNDYYVCLVRQEETFAALWCAWTFKGLTLRNMSPHSNSIFLNARNIFNQ